MKISSPAFQNNGAIPQKYSCQGQDARPELKIGDVPSAAKSLALIVDDPDAPRGTFVHWVVFNIPPSATEISGDGAPGREGLNSSGRKGWTSPCPPSGTHRYFFKLYALDTDLALDGSADKQSLESAMKGHVVGEAQIMGTYSKK
jgi:Raf kinase inhibitor-like YbhB/YbcL family protein